MVEGFRGCFRQEVFVTFQHLLVGWIIAPGPRTISEVWQATGRAGKEHWDRAYALFASASWGWDDLSKILVPLIVARLIPTGAIWIVVDDTHRVRAAQVGHHQTRREGEIIPPPATADVDAVRG